MFVLFIISKHGHFLANRISFYSPLS